MQDEILQMWSTAIGERKRKKFLSKKDKICDLHFLPKDVIKDFFTKLPDGSVHCIERERYMLKEGAVPFIFPQSHKAKADIAKSQSEVLKQEVEFNIERAFDLISTNFIIIPLPSEQ